MNCLYTGARVGAEVQVVSLSLGGFDFRNFLRGILIVVSGALMILPAYLNYLIFSRLHIELVISLSISIILFALGILLFIIAAGTETFEKKQ